MIIYSSSKKASFRKTFRKLFTNVFSILFMFCCQFNLWSQATSSTLAITNATIINGTGSEPIKNGTLLINNGIIECVGNCEVPEEYEVIDAKGQYVIPGLIDTHVHYSMGGWIDSFPIPGLVPDVSEDYPYAEVLEDLQSNYQKFHNSYLCSGVTAVFDTGGYPWLFDIREDSKNLSQAPHYYTTGPLFSFEDMILPIPAADDMLFAISEESRLNEGLELLYKLNTNGINFHNLHNAPSHEVLRERLQTGIAKFKDREDVQFMAFCKGLEEAKIAIRQGIEVFVYSIDEEVVDEEFLKLAKENDVIYVPTLGVAGALVDTQNGHIPEELLEGNCIDNSTLNKTDLNGKYYDYEYQKEKGSIKSNIIPDPKAMSIRQENLMKISKAGIKIGLGSSAGVPFLFHGPSTHYEMIKMHEAGLSTMEVLVASTKNGAKVIGNDKIGTLEKGKIADLVILNGNPLEDLNEIKNIDQVLRAGEVVR